MAATRLKHHPRYEGLATIKNGKARWTGEVRLNHDVLEQPLRWRKPRRVFPCSMSDLFHEGVPFRFVDKVMAIAALCPQHTFQILTKRPGRMLEYLCDYPSVCDDGNIEHELTSNPVLLWEAARLFGGTPERYCDVVGVNETQASSDYMVELSNLPIFPLPNVHLGVSVEDQAAADERRKDLEPCPAAVKFVSYEPALGPVDWTGWEFVSQIISGGESGPGARPSHPDWHRATRDFCQENEIAYFMKQWGGWVPNEAGCGGDYHFNSKHICLNLAGEVFDGWMEAHGKRITIMAKASKKAAGHLLDGRAWQQFPVAGGAGDR